MSHHSVPQSGVSRRRPSISFENEEHAFRNIEIKLEALRNALDVIAQDPGEDHKTLFACLPKNRTQFNRWDSENVNSTLIGVKFSRNAPATLRRYPAAAAAVLAATETLKALLRRRGARPTKLESIASLKRKLILADTQKKILEIELIALRRRSNAMEVDLLTVGSDRSANAREAENKLKESELEISRLRAENSKLTAELLKVVSFKRAK